jgi:lipoprotein-releasing system permease protein
MSYEAFIGRRYLRARKKEAFISLISLLSMAGVTLGVMALIVVIAVMSGAESSLQERILMIQPHVTLMRYGDEFYDYRPIQKQIEATDGVISASPFTYTQAMLRSPAGIAGAVIKGIEPQTAGFKIGGFDSSTLQLTPPADRNSGDNSDRPRIILGHELARKLKVKLGDSVYVIASRGKSAPLGRLPRMKPFEVAGFFETGLYEYDQSFAFINLKQAQELAGLGDAVHGIEIRVRELFKAGELAQEIGSRFGFPYWARDWMRANRNVFLSLKQQKIVMFIILSLIVLVAAFSITSSLIMMVIEKTKDIAILKSMGATDRSIRKIFIFKGMAIGSIGTLLGMAFGFALCTILRHYNFIDLPGDVYYFTTLPVKLELVDVAVISSAALLICLLATFYPAHRASKLDPVEGIRIG